MVVGRKPLLPFINTPNRQSFLRIRPRYFLQLRWKRTYRYWHSIQEHIRKRAFVQYCLRRKPTVKVKELKHVANSFSLPPGRTFRSAKVVTYIISSGIRFRTFIKQKIDATQG